MARREALESRERAQLKELRSLERQVRRARAALSKTRGELGLFRAEAPIRRSAEEKGISVRLEKEIAAAYNAEVLYAGGKITRYRRGKMQEGSREDAVQAARDEHATAAISDGKELELDADVAELQAKYPEFAGRVLRAFPVGSHTLSSYIHELDRPRERLFVRGKLVYGGGIGHVNHGTITALFKLGMMREKGAKK